MNDRYAPSGIYQSEKPPAQRKRRIGSWLKWTALVLLGVCVAGYWYVRYDFATSASKLASQVVLVRTFGVPLSGADFERLPKTSPEKNAAEFYQRAFREFSNVPARKYAPFDPEFRRAVEFPDSKYVGIVDTYLRPYEPALKLAMTGSQLERCEFSRNWNNPNDPASVGFIPLDKIAEIMAMRAVVRARKGMLRESLDAIKSMVRMSQHIQQEPSLIAGIISARIDGLIWRTAEACATFWESNPAGLIALQIVVQNAPRRKAASHFLKSMVYSGYWLTLNLTEEFEREKKLSRRYPNMVGLLSNHSRVRLFPLPFESELCEQAYAARYLEYWNSVFGQLTRNPEAIDGGRSVLKSAYQKLEQKERFTDYLPKMLIPDISITVKYFVTTVSQRKCVEILLKCLLQKENLGSLPADLDSIGVKAIDGNTGLLIRYVKWEGGCRIYCIGENGRDFNGQFPFEERTSEREPPLIAAYPVWHRMPRRSRKLSEAPIESKQAPVTRPNPPRQNGRILPYQ